MKSHASFKIIWQGWGMARSGELLKLGDGGMGSPPCFGVCL